MRSAGVRPLGRPTGASHRLALFERLVTVAALAEAWKDQLAVLAQARRRRLLSILVDTANQIPEESDVLELIRDSWAQIGVRLFTKPFTSRCSAGAFSEARALCRCGPCLDNEPADR